MLLCVVAMIDVSLLEINSTTAQTFLHSSIVFRLKGYILKMNAFIGIEIDRIHGIHRDI